jgi:hypothetical protein
MTSVVMPNFSSPSPALPKGFDADMGNCEGFPFFQKKVKELENLFTPVVLHRKISTFTRKDCLETMPLRESMDLDTKEEQESPHRAEKKSSNGTLDANSDDELGDTLNDMSSNLRGSLKIVRDPSKNAFDILPTGETLGAFANKHAVARYSRKVENKRERARETRKKKRNSEIIYKTGKKRKTLNQNESEFFNTREGIPREATL